MIGIRLLIPALLVSLLLFACATPASVVTTQDTPVVVKPEAEPTPEPVPEPEPTPTPEPQPEPEPAPAVEPAAPIEVSEDLYNQAFAEVEAVINDLNKIISRGQFDVWKTYLTDRYIAYYSDPQVLAEVGSQPILSQNNIKIRTLRDYFENVVVPSRAHVRLDDLIFYSDTLVEAVTEFRGQRVILYLLRKIDGSWKIDTREALPADQTGADGTAGSGGDG